MLRQLNVGQRLAAGFAAVLVLMACISAVSISRLAFIRHELTTVTGDDAAQLRLAVGLRDLARHQGVTLRDLILQEDFPLKAKELANLKAARADYRKTEEALQAATSDSAVKAALAAAATARQATQGPVEEALNLSMSEDQAGASALVRDKVRPAQLAEIAALQKVVDAVESASQARAASVESSYSQAVRLIVALSLGAALAGAFIAWSIRRSIVGPLGQAVAAARAVADGDLTHAIDHHRRDEVGQLLDALRTVNDRLGGMLHDVRQAAQSMRTAASEIAAGNADLSQRTEHQAAQLQQTTASMQQLADAVQNNAGTALSATHLAGDASAAAERGGAAVRTVIDTMGTITTSSRRIHDITGVIDGIAFQTNILALNAAVEAARAGEQGRGFAVVAGEVRTLAQRSAHAAQEIKSLITESVATIEAGSAQVDDAGRTMDEIVAQVRRVSQLIGEIGSASQAQTDEVGLMRDAVSTLDQVTQQNAALVEQSAAAAASLDQQAGRLVESVGIFRIEAQRTLADAGA